jgi:RimJ/RimL family protein N-acetyltransferase/L-amino acid N-acyltransferase YncA
MNLTQFSFESADPEHYFDAVTSLINTQETEPNTVVSLTEWYNKQGKEDIRLTVLVTKLGDVLGFFGIYRSYTNLERNYSVYLITGEEFRECGLGSLMYHALLNQAYELGARTLRARVRDTCEEGMRFATQRGFLITKHSIEMMFDLKAWDEQRYLPMIQSLEAQGFRFTNMAELGNTLEARQRLYALNNDAATTDPGSDGVPPWASFEEFERDVCSSSWYHPDAQFVAIDTHTGEWAAMSAITVFEGADHAYNLFTGTDVRYRGKKLAQAVKSLALRRARAWGVDTVRTSHNSENEAMIAIDTKLGYIRTPGTYIMVKELGG